MKLVKEYVKGNEFLKNPNYVEYINKKEFKKRIKEISRCKKDPIYFAENYYYIINPEKGKHIISLYPKQKELIRTFQKEDRIVVLASRQVGKTTAYNIFALWLTMFHPEQSVLICANTGDSASEFVSRIKLAYELIPMWLKPGVKGWNARSISFSNDSKILAAPTSPGVRGKTGNCLILDEMAFVEPRIEKEFWEAVYPTVSSSKGTKVIMVSTPNGTGNLFYETWDRAVMGISDDGWKPFRIDWFEVPGRDETWKKKQIASMNGDMRAWAQEFGNTFFGSAQTLIEGSKIRELKEFVLYCQEQNDKPEQLNFGDSRNIFDMNIWFKPDSRGTYIIGADGGEGIGGDFSTILVFDISNLRNLKLVASYGSNEISTKEFAYLLVKVAQYYKNAFIAIENNGITKGIVDDIWHVYEYDNLVNIGSKGKIGIDSKHKVKLDACMWLKNFLQCEEVKTIIKEPFLINEMEFFERKLGVRSIFQAAGNKHDDYIMSFIWAIYALNPSKIENYYDVTKWMKTSVGVLIPERINSYNDTGYSYDKNYVDERFKSNVFNLETSIPSQTQNDEAPVIFLGGDEVEQFYF